MIDRVLVRLALLLPRGGAFLLRHASRMFPGLRRYPISLLVAPGLAIEADLAANVFFPLLKYGCYPHQLSEDFVSRAILRAGDTVLDVGANIGYTSLLYSGSIGREGIVYAFEPSRINVRYLGKIASMAGNVMVVNCAVSDISADLFFADSRNLDMSSVSDGNNARAYRVPCVSIDDWVGENGIKAVDFLKIDAEGSDVRILSGARKTLAAFEPIVEFESLSEEEYSMAAEVIGSLGGTYRIFRFCNPYPFSVIGRELSTSNYLAVPDSRSARVPSLLFDQGLLQGKVGTIPRPSKGPG